MSKIGKIGAQGARQRGKQAQRQGASVEARILDSAARAGWLLVHVPPPVQILRPLDGGGSRLVVCRLESPRAPDFLGVDAGGRAVAIEAKSAARDAHPTSYPLPERLRGHQGEALAAVAARGGIAFVLLLRVGAWAGEEEVYRIPWPEGDPRRDANGARLSWPWAAIEKWRVAGGLEGAWEEEGDR